MKGSRPDLLSQGEESVKSPRFYEPVNINEDKTGRN